MILFLEQVMFFLEIRHLIFWVSLHVFVLILGHFSFILTLWTFSFLLWRIQNIQTGKYKKIFWEKKTFTKEINLGQIKNEPKTCLYLYDYTLSFFWNSLDFLKISSILLHFLQISSPKLVGPPSNILHSPLFWVWETCRSSGTIKNSN